MTPNLSFLQHFSIVKEVCISNQNLSIVKPFFAD